jgi:hypothetical protein
MNNNIAEASRFFGKVTLLCALLLSANVMAELPPAQQVAGNMKIGWNLGNTLEVTWANPGTTTQAAIDSVKAAGFSTVRLPVAWFHHADTNANIIDANWFPSVKKVVDFCINDNLYVIINAHWDHGWLENRVDAANKDKVNERQRAFWTQIAEYFKNYDEHLLFAGANEPNASDAAGTAILLSYHQTFIDAVRATGGNNSSRTLIIQGPSTDVSNTIQFMKTMPTDKIDNRIILEVHYYTPWNFCGMEKDESWGKMFYYWGAPNHSTSDAGRNATWGEERAMDSLLGLMKTRFIDKGIPVIIGEYGAFRKNLNPPADQALHNASIEYYYRYFVKSAMSKGIIPYCWDTGGIFDFKTGRVVDRVVLKAIMQGAAEAFTGIADDKKKSGKSTRKSLVPGLNCKVDNPDEIVRISMYDMMGRLIATVAPSEFENLSATGFSLNSNVYVVKVQGRNRTTTLRILKK